MKRRSFLGALLGTPAAVSIPSVVAQESRETIAVGNTTFVGPFSESEREYIARYRWQQYGYALTVDGESVRVARLPE